MVIEPQGTFYTKVKPKDIPEIISKSIQGQEIITDRLFTDPVTNKKIEKYHDVTFFTHQHRIALRNLGKIAAHSINE